MTAEERAPVIVERLRKRYPAPEPALHWQDAWQLLVATMLAAQCTDVRVNQVTPEFFRRWPTVAHAARAPQEEVETVIRSTGFFRNKAKNIIASAQRIVEHFDGAPPRGMEGMLTLPGVARKTANIVLSNAYGLHEGLAVDTHVKRLSFRMGLTTATDPVKIEKDLMPLFPKQEWGNVNHLLVFFGREICPARSPRCGVCELADICPKLGVAT